MDGGVWWAAVHGVAKSRTRLSDFTFTFHFHALEKEMATHSSFLAWRIPGTGEPGGLPSMGSHRVGHNWSDLVAAAVAAEIFYEYFLQMGFFEWNAFVKCHSLTWVLRESLSVYRIRGVTSLFSVVCSGYSTSVSSFADEKTEARFINFSFLFLVLVLMLITCTFCLGGSRMFYFYSYLWRSGTFQNGQMHGSFLTDPFWDSGYLSCLKMWSSII